MSPGLGETPTLTQISEYASKIMAPTQDNRDDLGIFVMPGGTYGPVG